MNFPYRCRLPLAGFALICFFAMSAVTRAQEAGPQIGTLLVAGDIAKCDPASGKDEATAAILDDEIAKAKAAGLPVRILALGDLAYDKGTEAQFQCYDASWGSNGKKAITLPVCASTSPAQTPGSPATVIATRYARADR